MARPRYYDAGGIEIAACATATANLWRIYADGEPVGYARKEAGEWIGYADSWALERGRPWTAGRTLEYVACILAGAIPSKRAA